MISAQDYMIESGDFHYWNGGAYDTRSVKAFLSVRADSQLDAWDYYDAPAGEGFYADTIYANGDGTTDDVVKIMIHADSKEIIDEDFDIESKYATPEAKNANSNTRINGKKWNSNEYLDENSPNVSEIEIHADTDWERGDGDASISLMSVRVTTKNALSYSAGCNWEPFPVHQPSPKNDEWVPYEKGMACSTYEMNQIMCHNHNVLLYNRLPMDISLFWWTKEEDC